MSVEEGCYPVKATLCAAAAPSPIPPTSGYCGDVNNTIVTEKPSANLCKAGTPTAVTDKGSTYEWTCQKILTDGADASQFVDASCRAYKPLSCGGAHGKTYTSAAQVNAAGLCNNGEARAVTGDGPWNWTCSPPSGFPGSAVDCYAERPGPDINSCAIKAIDLPDDVQWTKIGSDTYRIGAIGDNYWCSPTNQCMMVDRTIYFNVANPERITEFYFYSEGWDDVMQIVINGQTVWNTRETINTGNPPHGGTFPTRCEWSTSWTRSDHINIRPYLRNGTNQLTLRTWVEGCGESWGDARIVDNCTP